MHLVLGEHAALGELKWVLKRQGSLPSSSLPPFWEDIKQDHSLSRCIRNPLSDPALQTSGSWEAQGLR